MLLVIVTVVQEIWVSLHCVELGLVHVFRVLVHIVSVPVFLFRLDDGAHFQGRDFALAVGSEELGDWSNAMSDSSPT